MAMLKGTGTAWIWFVSSLSPRGPQCNTRSANKVTLRRWCLAAIIKLGFYFSRFIFIFSLNYIVVIIELIEEILNDVEKGILRGESERNTYKDIRV